MSEQIKLDAASLSDIAVQIKQVSSRLEDVENKISQALTALDWEVRSKEDIEGNINDIKNNLVRQRENLNAMTGVIEIASGKTNEINADLARVALSIVTAVLASVSVFNPIGKIGVISYLTGVKDWLTNVTGGGESSSNNGVNARGTSGSGGEGNSAANDSASIWGDKSGVPIFVSAYIRGKDFDKSIWPAGYNLGSGCGVATMSMLLSTLGLDVKPKEIMSYNNASNPTYMDGAYDASHYQGIVNEMDSKIKNGNDVDGDLDKALNNYLEHPGEYSAPMIWLNFSDTNHAVLVIGRNKNGSYKVLDSSGRNITVYKLCSSKETYDQAGKDKFFETPKSRVIQYRKG